MRNAVKAFSPARRGVRSVDAPRGDGGGARARGTNGPPAILPGGGGGITDGGGTPGETARTR